MLCYTKLLSFTIIYDLVPRATDHGLWAWVVSGVAIGVLGFPPQDLADAGWIGVARVSERSASGPKARTHLESLSRG